jgi:hypothetical protein
MSIYTITLTLSDFFDYSTPPVVFSMFNKRTLKETRCTLRFEDEKGEPMARLYVDETPITESFSDTITIQAIHTNQYIRLLAFGEIFYEKPISDKYDLLVHSKLVYTKEQFDARKDKKDMDTYLYTMELAQRDDEVRDLLEKCGIML